MRITTSHVVFGRYNFIQKGIHCRPPLSTPSPQQPCAPTSTSLHCGAATQQIAHSHCDRMKINIDFEKNLKLH